MCPPSNPPRNHHTEIAEDAMSLFTKVSTEKLRLMAEELGGIYADCHQDMRAAQFARTLSVMMRCELARREADEDAA